MYIYLLNINIYIVKKSNHPFVFKTQVFIDERDDDEERFTVTIGSWEDEESCRSERRFEISHFLNQLKSRQRCAAIFGVVFLLMFYEINHSNRVFDVELLLFYLMECLRVKPINLGPIKSNQSRP